MPASLLVAMGLIQACVIIAATGPPGPVTGLGWIAVGAVTVALMTTAPWLWRKATTRVPFYLLMALSSTDLVVIATDSYLR